MSSAPVFLDRDGTLIVEKGYLRDPDQAFLEDTVVEGLSTLSAHGHPLIVVSNQSGIGRGMLTNEDAQHVNNSRVDALKWSPRGSQGRHAEPRFQELAAHRVR